MKFRIKVKSEADPQGWWEEYEREVGQSNFVRGYGYQPVFNGDVHKFGQELVDWFNKGKTTNLRTFLKAEKFK